MTARTMPPSKATTVGNPLDMAMVDEVAIQTSVLDCYRLAMMAIWIPTTQL